MNIFHIDKDPRQCAVWMVDRHVVKMILETAQLLSTAHRVIDGTVVLGHRKQANGSSRKIKQWVLNDARETILYKATHVNHPSAIWVRESVENYNWLVDHMFALGDEYTYRYGKRHLTIEKLAYTLQSPPFNLKQWDWTVPPSAMDEKYIVSDDPVVNYRNYYNKGKRDLHKWTRRDSPTWII